MPENIKKTAEALKYLGFEISVDNQVKLFHKDVPVYRIMEYGLPEVMDWHCVGLAITLMELPEHARNKIIAKYKKTH